MSPSAALPSLPPGIAELEALGVRVAALALDSRQVRPGDVFLACPGLRQDGRAYIDEAIGRGAADAGGHAPHEFRTLAGGQADRPCR